MSRNVGTTFMSPLISSIDFTITLSRLHRNRLHTLLCGDLCITLSSLEGDARKLSLLSSGESKKARLTNYLLKICMPKLPFEI